MSLAIGSSITDISPTFQRIYIRTDVPHSLTIIYFWSISCPACHGNIPSLRALRDKYAVLGLELVAIHMPRGEAELDEASVRRVATELGITEPYVLDNDHTLTDAFEVTVVPTYFLFSADGKLKRHAAGGFGVKMMASALQRLLPENRVPT